MNPYTPIEQENVTEEEASHPVDASPRHIIHKKDYDSMIQKKNTAKVRITLGFIKNETLVFVNSGCINFAHHQKEVLRIPKHPNLQNSDYFELRNGNLKKMEDLQKSGS